MKITDVQAIIVRQPEISMIGDGSQDTVVIKVMTDEGITGIGEVDSSPYVVKAIVESPASHMVCMVCVISLWVKIRLMLKKSGTKCTTLQIITEDVVLLFMQ